MKKKYVCLMFASLFAASFCGCYNMRTDPNESLDKVTFCEWCEHYLLFAHDCRRSREKCRPICDWDKKQFSRNQKEEQRRWAAFKYTDIYPYNPTNTPVLDEIGSMLVNVSKQLHDEVVVPYVELDKQGHIQAYRQFCMDVNYRMNSLKIDRITAEQDVYKYWETHYGTEKCQELMAAIPFIENMRVDWQLLKAINDNLDYIIYLCLYPKEAAAQFKEKTKTVNGWVDIAAALVQYLEPARQFRRSVSYLWDLKKQEYQVSRDMRATIERIQKYNKRND